MTKLSEEYEWREYCRAIILCTISITLNQIVLIRLNVINFFPIEMECYFDDKLDRSIRNRNNHEISGNKQEITSFGFPLSEWNLFLIIGRNIIGLFEFQLGNAGAVFARHYLIWQCWLLGKLESSNKSLINVHIQIISSL